MVSLSPNSVAVGDFEENFYKLLISEEPNLLKSYDAWNVGEALNNETCEGIRDKIAWWLFESDPNEALAEIQKLNNPSQLCGHVFKSGEATYTCRECAVDRTCVLCRKCFQQSEHKKHKYMLHSSGGGGCCDCGDSEAWTKYPSCSEHDVMSDSNTADAKAKLPTILQNKANEVFKVLLHYIVDASVSVREEHSDLPPPLHLESPSDQYVTVVFNDESHTFDHVIKTLSDAIGCTSSVASDYATLIDREGRSAILLGDNKSCTDCKTVISNALGGFRQRIPGPLQTRVMHSSIYAYQELALFLMSWLESIAKESEGLRIILAQCILKEDPSYHATFVTTCMLNDALLWKGARNGYHQLVLAVVMLHLESKKKFGVEYVRSYEELVKEFLKDDHEHADSILSMSVQVFTVPTLVRYLIIEENLLLVLLKTVINAFCTTIESNDDNPDATPVYQLDNRKMRTNFRRMLYALYNIKYVLSNVPTDWDAKLQKKFQQFFRTFVAFFYVLEGMDSVVHKSDRHVEYDQEWETGITLLMRLIPILKPLYQWCSISKDVLIGCLHEAITQLQKKQELHNSKSSVVYNGKTYTLTDFDVMSKPVSVLVPLTRLTAGLLVQCGKLGISVRDSGMHLDVLTLAEHSLQAVSLCAQVVAGCWRRNGLSLANQVYYCHDNQCRAEAFDRDLQMLQLCAALADPNDFFVLLHTRLKLNDEPKIAGFVTPLHNELLSLLIYVCVERFTEGVGQVTIADIARHELIHILASGPRPHSKINKHLPDEVSETPGWEKMLEEVADYKTATSATAVARYELKESYLDKVSPCFFHYSTPTAQTNAQNEVIRRKKAANQSCIFMPHLSPPFVPLFSKVPDLLHCPTLIHFIKETLERLLDESAAQTLRWSDKLFEKILFLIGFAILEERERVIADQSSYFQFCDKAQKCGLLDCLRRLSDFPAASLHKDNIAWIMNGVEEVENRRQGIECEDFRFLLVKDGESERLIRKQKAEDRRRKLMSQMSLQQKNFLVVNPTLNEEITTSEDAEMQSQSSTQEALPEKPQEPVVEPEPATPVGRQMSQADVDEPKVCILCQDDSVSSDCLVISAFVQRSSVLAKRKHVNVDLDYRILPDMTFPAGIHVSSCSHVMHYRCWEQFFATVKSKEESRHHRVRRLLSVFSTDRNEYLCPLCSRLSNCVLPVISPDKVPTFGPPSGVVSLSNWMKTMEDLVDPPTDDTKQEVVAHLDLEDMVTSEDNCDVWHDASDVMSESQASTAAMATMEEVGEDGKGDSIRLVLDTMNKSFDMNCPGDSESEDPCLPLWLAAATTCQVVEAVARYRNRPLMAPPSIRVSQTLASTMRSSVILANRHKGLFQKSREAVVRTVLGKSATPLLCKHIFACHAHFYFASLTLGDIPVGASHRGARLLSITSLAQIVQIILFVDLRQVCGEVDNDSTLSQLFNQVRSYANLPTCTRICDEKLHKVIFTSFQPFVRSCSLFTRYVTNKPYPTSLEGDDNFVSLLEYLDLPKTVHEYFDISGNCSLDPLVQRWCSHPDVIERCKETTSAKVHYPDLSEINVLVPLAQDYSDVIAMGANFVCPRFRSDDDSVNPTMCLICGQMLCSQSYCCQQSLNESNVGACTYHAFQCNFGYGMFLRVRESTVVLINDSRGTFRPAPYLDEYGETDQGLRRGHPLMLDSERLRELNLVWLEHTVPEEIVRAMEANRSWINVAWDHM